MRYFPVLLISVLFTLNAYSQTDSPTTTVDTLAPYQKNPTIPTFSIQTPDSSWFNKAALNEKKPTLIVYFSPDCGHCQQETEAILSKIKSFPNLQIVMITSRPFEDMKNFAEFYKLQRFPTIKIGYDPKRYVTRFYNVKYTPFSALYDKKGKLVKVYDNKAIDLDELVRLGQ